MLSQVSPLPEKEEFDYEVRYESAMEQVQKLLENRLGEKENLKAEQE